MGKGAGDRRWCRGGRWNNANGHTGMTSKKPELRYMLDTNICIYVMRGNQRIIHELEKHAPEEICISVITYAELMHGAEKSQYAEKTREKMWRFLENIQVLEWGRAAAEEYGRVRVQLEKKGIPISSNDMFIAAHANSCDLTLVTHNVGEFARVEGLEVTDWC